MITSTNFKVLEPDAFSYIVYLYEIGRRRALTSSTLYRKSATILTREETLLFCKLYSHGASKLIDDENELIDKFAAKIDDLLEIEENIELNSVNPFYRDREEEEETRKSWREELQDEDDYRRNKEIREWRP